jgi:hypothetical protein
VTSKVSDAGIYKVLLKKDGNNEAIVQVEKDPQTGNRRIILTRLEKTQPPATQPKQAAEPPKPPST